MNLAQRTQGKNCQMRKKYIALQIKVLIYQEVMSYKPFCFKEVVKMCQTVTGSNEPLAEILWENLITNPLG